MHWTSAVTKSHTLVSAAAAAAVNDAQATTRRSMQRARVGVPVCAEVTTRAATDAR